MKFNTLYGKDSRGGLKLWEVFTEGSAITVRHGKLGGKIQAKVTHASPKNVGKANETTPEYQAELEAEAKWVKQKKKGYCETKEEALAYVDDTPMKAHNYNDYADRVEYACYAQPKLNGLRLKLNSEGDGLSKQGEAVTLPAHWIPTIEALRIAGYLEHGLDGEVFAGYQKQGGLSLQQINAAFKKPNKDTHKLKYYVYDVPCPGMTMDERVVYLGMLQRELQDAQLEIVFVPTSLVLSEAAGDALYAEYLEAGAEGMMYRNRSGKYENGKRSYDLIKRKPRLDAEAMVLSSKEDKNGDGVLSCRLENGIEFECLMRKDSHPTTNYRKHVNALALVGSFITFEYEELSDAGVPTKPVGIGVRAVDSTTFEPLE